MSKMGNVFVEIDGKVININALPREEYEYFLELMHKLRLVYISLTRIPGQNDNKDKV